MFIVELQGFNLKMLKHLVLDEADRLLNMDFEEEIDHILKAIPKVISVALPSTIHHLSVAPWSTDMRRIGPQQSFQSFIILETIQGNLPPHIPIHADIHAQLLLKAPENPLETRIHDYVATAEHRLVL